MKRFFGFSRSVRFTMIAMLSAGMIIFVGLGLESKMASSDPMSQAPVTQQSSAPSKFSISKQPNPPVSAASQLAVQPAPIPTATAPPTPMPMATATPIPVAPPSNLTPTVKTAYGHLPYEENEAARLAVVGQYVRDGYARDEILDIEAVQAFQKMAIAAKSAGVSLMPLSGFRTIAVQSDLFASQIQRKGSKEAAARWSAPPGYSEHHTGYAIDIADKQHPDTDLKTSFQETPAYQWLAANAGQFGFELSFPQNNWQGVSFEPWHWRFVGSNRAMQVFATARSIQ